MTRDEMVARMTSLELSGWAALFAVQAEEAEHRRDVLESGDGEVVRFGDEQDDDDEGDDGTTE